MTLIRLQEQQQQDKSEMITLPRSILMGTKERHLGSKEEVSTLQTASVPAGTMSEDEPQQLSSCRRKTVTFDSVTVRHYPMTLGDHPVCSYGAPVQLDWEYHERGVYPVDEYEKTHPRLGRRRMQEMVLTHYQRCDILERAGFSEEEIRRAQHECTCIKRQRSKTLFMSPANQVQEAVQDAGEKVTKILKRKGRREKKQVQAFFDL